MTRRSCALYAVGIVCAHLLFIGIGLWVAQVFRTVIHNRLKKEITLTEGSRVFGTWKSPPPPVYMQYFFFNLTNADEFEKGLAKPILTQVGPYTYREYRPKANVTHVNDGTMVSAYSPKTFIFMRERSVGDPEVDVITTANIPVWAVMEKMRNWAFYKITGFTWLYGKHLTLFTSRTVDELLWGYKDPLLERLSKTKPEVEETFGLMYKKNGTLGEEFVYHTGEQNYLDYGRVHTWRGERELSFWSSNQSNTINGTDGSAFHPLLKRDERLYIFTADLCRSIFMEYDKDVEVKGIPAYRFTPPRAVFASKEENPANEGFCVTPEECLGTGLLKVSPCRKGAPVVASFPHFYLADPKYVDAVEGLSPQKEHHQTFLDLNPTTGIPVRASKRAQVNLLVERIPGFTGTRKLNATVLPVMFLNESVVIDDVSVERLKKLLLIETLVSNFPLLIVALGGIMLIVFIILLVREHKQKKTAEKDTTYAPVNDKEMDETLKSDYISMTPTADKES